jgi:hypothetical protein
MLGTGHMPSQAATTMVSRYVCLVLGGGCHAGVKVGQGGNGGIDLGLLPQVEKGGFLKV